MKTSVVLGCFIGYFIWKLGMKMDYLLDLIGSPYNEIAALSANMWLLLAILFGQQVLTKKKVLEGGIVHGVFIMIYSVENISFPFFTFC